MSETDALRALMEADRWIDRVRSQKTHLPEIAELGQLETELRGLLKDLHDAEGALKPVTADYDTVARESQRLGTRARDLDDALSSSTASARELSAIQGELTHVRVLLGRSEDRELELLEALEPLEHQIASVKQLAQPGVSRRAELIETIAQLQVSLDDELTSLLRDRDERAVALSGSLLARYDAAMGRVGTSGAAQVVEGRCDGCRIALSPLDYDHFRARPPDTFMDCPECGRLLHG
ncbi:MAG: zinc ribbon domain-containing protein [Acidimicrobiales bacterium]